MVDVTDEMIETYQRDGVVLVKGLWADWVEELQAGVARNMAEPGPYAAENLKPGEAGRFFDDYCNWDRIPEFERVIKQSEVADVAAKLMGSERVQLFHDHVLVKEPGTSKPTPWHQDGPYYFVGGQQNVSFWSPLDPVKEASLRCVAGSHLWPKRFCRRGGWRKPRSIRTPSFTCRCRTRMPRGCLYGSGRWSRAMRWRLIIVPCMARGAILRAPGGGRFRCGFWAMMRAM